MHALNLVNMRVNNCIYSDFFQEVVTYIEIGEKSNKIGDPIDFIYAEFAKNYENNCKNGDIERIRERLGKSYRQIGSIPGCSDRTCANQIFYKKNKGDKRVIVENKLGDIQMNQYCCRWSFCHLPFQIQKEFNRKINDFCLGESSDRNSLLPKQQFILHMCIENQPGKLRKMLSKISGSENENGSPEYDFNIEHIRTSHCRVRDNAKIDIYGYFETPQKPNDNGNCSGIFYYVRGDNDKHISFSDFKTFGDCLTGIRSNKELQNKFEVKTGNNNPLTDSERALCAVARHGYCPLTQKDYRKKPKRMVKLQICLQNRPGSLLRAIETITIV